MNGKRNSGFSQAPAAMRSMLKSEYAGSLFARYALHTKEQMHPRQRHAPSFFGQLT